MTKKRVCMGVAPDLGFKRVQSLLRAISELFPVDFVPVGEACHAAIIKGIIELRGDGVDGCVAGVVNVPRLLYDPGTGAATIRRSPKVEFRALSSLNTCLRGQCMEDSDVSSFIPLAPVEGGEIVGSMEGCAFWIRQGSGQSSTDVVALDLPTLGAGGQLLDYFQPGRFVRLLPLLEFIRVRTSKVDWDPGPFRACFVFDDPSLVRPRFGCLDFRELASHARAYGYHAAIAMVPLDAVHAGNEAVEIFRKNPKHLSLIVHGNDHTYLELVNCSSDGGRLALLAQALRRIEAFERCHGMVVDRVMEPPHGGVARAMFPAMAALGFEAALTTAHHLFHFDPMESWPCCLGMDMAEVMPGGIATIPRIRMLPDWRTAAVLAGFLRQPIVIAGHHQDVAEGFGFLAEFAQMVAGFGPVRWLSPTGIARTNFKVRREGSCLLVKTYQRRVFVLIPDGVDQIMVERAWVTENESERLTVESRATVPMFSGVCGRVSPSFQVNTGDTLDIKSFFRQPVSAQEIPPPPRRLWPVARRLLTGTRDHCYSWLYPRSQLSAFNERLLNTQS
ncbi:MAG: hypothetical protein WCI03_08330 [bacterium]